MPLHVSPDVPDLLSLSITTGASSVRVEAAGEVDASSAPRLAAALEQAAAQGLPVVVTDLGAVTFLDSAGIHVLAGAYRRAAASGTRLRVVSSRRAVLRPLQLSGLWAMLGGDRAAEPDSAA